MKRTIQAFARFLKEEDGPTAVEYAVILAMIAMAVVGGVNFLAAETAQSFVDSANSISGAVGN